MRDDNSTEFRDVEDSVVKINNEYNSSRDVENHSETEKQGDQEDEQSPLAWIVPVLANRVFTTRSRSLYFLFSSGGMTLCTGTGVIGWMYLGSQTVQIGQALFGAFIISSFLMGAALSVVAHNIPDGTDLRRYIVGETPESDGNQEESYEEPERPRFDILEDHYPNSPALEVRIRSRGTPLGNFVLRPREDYSSEIYPDSITRIDEMDEGILPGNQIVNEREYVIRFGLMLNGDEGEFNLTYSSPNKNYTENTPYSVERESVESATTPSPSRFEKSDNEA